MTATSKPLDEFATWIRTYSGRVPGDDIPVEHLNASGLRGRADSQAAWLRWHDADLDPSFDALAREWYQVLEQARVETLASNDLPGIAHNLRCRDSDSASIRAVVHALARRVLAGDDTEPGPLPTASRCDAAREENARPPVLRWLFESLRQTRALAPRASQPALSAKDLLATLKQARSALHDPAGFAEIVRPLVADLAASYPDRTSAPSELALLNSDGVDSHALEATREDAAPCPAMSDNVSPMPSAIEPTRSGYAVYSTAWDQCVDAADLARPDDAHWLEELPEGQRRQAQRLAHRLLRRLLAAQLARWQFDLDSGRLDPRRLSRLLVPRSSKNVFWEEQASPVPEACVCFLVDQSGSMRGEPQRLAILALDLAVRTLNACHITTEVLGFTTRYGADNPVVAQWREAGSPASPGRLNALCHIVYQAAGQPWSRQRRHLGLMLRPGFGQENFDGEALDWAAQRLATRPEQRRILVVLSDGAPFDTATSDVHGRLYLEDHLREIIAAIERSPLHLTAIGTGRNIGRFFRNAVTLRSREAIGEALFGHLGELLSRGNNIASVRLTSASERRIARSVTSNHSYATSNSLSYH